jgi:hypothetical protein
MEEADVLSKHGKQNNTMVQWNKEGNQATEIAQAEHISGSSAGNESNGMLK